ncbi:Kinase associated domain containing protein [Euroglyphus maynei]|uniref:non-specific serine/threonine protein kinase n=1 Tax=Euroglyphus maynei TaxID=6958 RepID=A0A1Y3AUA5_EURMA|nr:Kinase associated domain containing protein [Euroglyphus maynei]
MNNQQTQTVGTEPVVKKIKENVATPKKSLLNGIHSTPVTPKIPPLLAERKQMLMNSANTDKHSPAPRVPMRLTPQQARQIKSPKLKKPMMYDENSTSIKASVKSPLANNGVTTIKSPLRDMRNQVLSPTINIQQIKASPKTATPTKSSASKKSLLRRLMASATPTSKSHSPRKLDTSMPSNNITMTSYKEPQECIDHLVRTLRAKGVECKQKNFTLKCFFTDRIHSSLKFELEICRFNGLCVIHRKRLNGDAWNYKKICELILQLSNEQQLAALNSDTGNKTTQPIQPLCAVETETRV